MPSKRIPKPNPRYREIAADPPTDKLESSSIMNGKLLVSPSTDRALFDRSDDEILSGNEPPTKKTTETSNLKCNCIGSFFVLWLCLTIGSNRAINATLIGGLSVARNEKDGDASLEVSTGPSLPTATVPCAIVAEMDGKILQKFL